LALISSISHSEDGRILKLSIPYSPVARFKIFQNVHVVNYRTLLLPYDGNRRPYYYAIHFKFDIFEQRYQKSLSMQWIYFYLDLLSSFFGRQTCLFILTCSVTRQSLHTALQLSIMQSVNISSSTYCCVLRLVEREVVYLFRS